MTRLSDYTTEELERLTTLTFDTMRPGEYVAPRPMVAQLCDVIPPSIRQSVGFKLSSGEIAGFDGSVAPHTTAAQSYAPRRRVTSFTDATELDPPQADMLAELARRKAPPLRFRKGDVVVSTQGYPVTYNNQGPCLATVLEDCVALDRWVQVDWDRRTGMKMDNGGYSPAEFRLATHADKAAFEARIPKAQRFAVGDLVAIGDEVLRIATLPNASKVPGYYGTESKFGELHYADRELRPATDAEVAAYHRAHCQPKAAPAKPEVNRVYVRKDGVGLGYRYRWNGEQWERQCMTEPWRDWKGRWVTGIFNDRCQERWEEGGFVPEPAPVVISNATHAGQWVQWNYGPCLVMAAGAQGDEKVEIVSLKGGRFYVRPDYLTLIDPSVWPK